MAKKCNDRFIHTIVSGTTFVAPIQVYDCCASGNPNDNPLPPADTCIVLGTRWVHDHSLDYCQISEGFNTGTLNEYQFEEQSVNGGPWIPTGNTKFTQSYNTTTCVLTPHRIAMSVGLAYDYSNEVNIPYSTSTIYLNAPTKIGYNYLFLSIPADKSFLVKDGTGIDITYLFSFIELDNRSGYRDNKIWRKNPKYFTESSLPFTLLIY